VAADSARALARRGHEIVVLAPARDGLPAIDSDGEGVVVRRVLRRGILPQTFADPIQTWRQARALRRHRFDLVVAHQATNAVGLASAGLGAPLVLVFHASPTLELRFLRGRTTGSRRLAWYLLDPAVAALERISARTATGILVLSRFSEQLLRSRHPRSAIHVVAAGVDEAFFADPANPQECRRRLRIPDGVFLFTARRLEPRMGVDVLIDALARLDDGVVLAVAGSGSAHADIERRVDALGLRSRVRLLGRVSEDDLRCLYRAADLFVLPTVAYEGFGMSTVEALAAGTPALGTAVGATPEILGALGEQFIVPAAEPGALAEAIRRVLPELGPDLRARARRLATERYQWNDAILSWERAFLAVRSVDANNRTANL
jgi:glycosyltransferase involved in cell wall biosynthesis